MTRRAWMVGAALAMLGATAGAKEAPAPTIHVMRHLDTPEGERDPDLTPTGQARAAALVRWFRGKPLAAIYVTGFRRTQQSIAALAAKRRLTPIVYGPAPSAEFIAGLRTAKGAVLVVGHSNTVPDIVAGVGGRRPAPLVHADFGDLWTVTGGKTEHARFGDPAK